MPSRTSDAHPASIDVARLLAERRDRLDQALAAFDARREDAARLIETIGRVVAAGGKVVTCGNGGSAAEALHLSEELVGRYRSNRPAIPAICLNADPTALTCIANDFGFDAVFARQCEALLAADDVLVVFSTSGRSGNLLRALDVARKRGAATVGFLGGDGGAALDRCDASIVVPGPDSAAIQEIHQMLMHAVCEQFESAG
jgi:D-sedoheptulose 7-phosphate isomerase